MKKERHKLPLDERLKRTQARLTTEALRNNRPQDIPAMHADLDENGKFKKHPKGDPLYRPKEDPDEDEIDTNNRKLR